MKHLITIHGWTIHYCKRLANAVADAFVMSNSPFVDTFRTCLTTHIQEDYLQEKKTTMEYTRSFYVVPTSETSRTPPQFSDDLEGMSGFRTCQSYSYGA